MMQKTEKQLAGWRVLLVDNDANSLDILETLMHFYGAVIFSKINGEEGLQSARHDKPDFIITDISMPVMDGWEMIKALKDDAETQTIPIIVLSAHAMAGNQEMAKNLGAEAYVLKPFHPSTFLGELLAVLSRLPQFASRFDKR
ncbi:MAG: response regulator [Aggregatilineales bacterium]